MERKDFIKKIEPLRGILTSHHGRILANMEKQISQSSFYSYWKGLGNDSKVYADIYNACLKTRQELIEMSEPQPV